jgi:hypothetical protein
MSSVHDRQFMIGFTELIYSPKMAAIRMVIGVRKHDPNRRVRRGRSRSGSQKELL